MKKLLALAILLLLVPISVMSETVSEITFRDIPWGCSISEVQEYLEKAVFEYNADFEDWDYDIEIDWMPYTSGLLEEGSTIGYDNCTEYECGYSARADILDSGMTIAGQELMSIHCVAHFGETETGISKEIDDSKFYAATYILITGDMEAAYADLQGKLSYLYGECDTLKEQNKYSAAYKYTSTWYGTNNTAITLCADGDFPSYLTICYYKTDCDEKLIKIDEAMEKLELDAQFENADLTGL